MIAALPTSTIPTSTPSIGEPTSALAIAPVARIGVSGSCILCHIASTTSLPLSANLAASACIRVFGNCATAATEPAESASSGHSTRTCSWA